jgi:hypothetical protein
VKIVNSGTAAQPKGRMRWSIDPRGRDVMFFGSVVHELGIAFADCLNISLTRVGSVSD